MARTYDAGRRSFMKSSTAAVAGAALSGGGLTGAVADSAAGTGATAINPDVDDLRVVYVHDPSMINLPTTTPISEFLSKYCFPNGADGANAQNINGQVQYTNKERIAANLDRMAVTLLQPKYPTITASAAWAKLFRSSKPWGQTKVMVKLNARHANHCVNLAIIDKVCRELINLGVVASNIIIYDWAPGFGG